LSAWKANKINSFTVIIEGQEEKVDIFQVKVRGINYYLLRNKTYFSGNVYDGGSINKYLFFSRAALEALKLLNFKPDIIHAHDFHSVSILTELSFLPRSERPGLVLTIHNLRYQGRTTKKSLVKFGFKSSDFKVKDRKGRFNLLAAGINRADKITTVSPNYAKEILTTEFGYGLEGLLKNRRQDLVGILNGIDEQSYNPALDKKLAQVYTAKEVQMGKKVNKKAVRDYLKLEQLNVPLFVFIARFSGQKGLDLFITQDLLKLQHKFPFQLIVLGSGEDKYEQMMLKINRVLPESMRTVIAFDEILARNLYAAADYFLIPSKFEPCGLTQMMAMRYGAVPIVRATGGLKDTVINKETGLVFNKYTSKAFSLSLQEALNIYYKQVTLFKKMRSNGLKQDWSWQASAPKYKRLYQKT
jgi:starch synthase